MFDLGWSELAVVALVALLVIGPRELPEILRTAGHWMRKFRSMAREFQSSVDDMVREAELDDARKAMDSARHLNIEQQIEDAVDPTGAMKDEVADIGDAASRAAKGLEETAGSGGAEDEVSGATIVEQPAQPAPPHSVVPPGDEPEATAAAPTKAASKGKSQSA